jgi:hypothetical protein
LFTSAQYSTRLSWPVMAKPFGKGTGACPENPRD